MIFLPYNVTGTISLTTKPINVNIKFENHKEIYVLRNYILWKV